MYAKTIMAACVGVLLSAPVLAQTPPPPPQGPTDVQCREGYREGMPWTREQFTAACAKLRQQKNNP